MGFWLAIHCEDIELTNRLMEFDIYLRQLVALCMHKKPEKPDGFKPPEPAEKTGVGMIGNNLIKKLARAKYENEF
jgi:hypothetical protein